MTMKPQFYSILVAAITGLPALVTSALQIEGIPWLTQLRPYLLLISVTATWLTLILNAVKTGQVSQVAHQTRAELQQHKEDTGTAAP